MVEREKEMWMVKVWSHGCEVSEYEVEDRQCLYMHPGQSPGFYHAGTSASPVAVLVAQSLQVAVQDGASSLDWVLTVWGLVFTSWSHEFANELL